MLIPPIGGRWARAGLTLLLALFALSAAQGQTHMGALCKTHAPKTACNPCKYLPAIAETPLQGLQSPVARCRNLFAEVAKPCRPLPKTLCKA